MARRKRRRIPPLSYYDREFMESPPGRPLRILSEYLDPLVRLRQAGVGDTIVIFGSARIFPRDVALEKIHAMQKRMKKRPSAEMRAELRGAKCALKMSRYYEDARELSRRITAWSMSFGSHPRRFVICSGGGPGIMEAANRGAEEAGGVTVGLNIQLPNEQLPNPYITPELSFNFHYFFMRKLWFAQVARALIVFPGGFGTMDELWEMMTLVQTGKLSERNLILIYGREYWDKVMNIKEMIRAGTVTQEEYNLLQFADTVEEAFDHVARGLEKHHLRLDSDWTGAPAEGWPA
jgi:uncharacterized protein (TIGR00730 family)